MRLLNDGLRPRFLASITAAALLVTSAPALAAPPDPDPWFGKDKALHFTASASIAGLGYGATGLFSTDPRIRVVFGGGAALAAGAGKELLDLAGLGDPSWKDFAWDVIGTLVGVGISLALDSAALGAQPGHGYTR